MEVTGRRACVPGLRQVSSVQLRAGRAALIIDQSNGSGPSVAMVTVFRASPLFCRGLCGSVNTETRLDRTVDIYDQPQRGREAGLRGGGTKGGGTGAYRRQPVAVWNVSASASSSSLGFSPSDRPEHGTRTRDVSTENPS